MNNKYLIVCLLVSVSLTLGQYQCQWYTFSNSGGILIATNIRAQTTIGQTVIGNLTSANVLGYIGFWYPSLSVGIVDDKDEAILPNQQLVTKLENAQPNPFKTQTTIRFSLASPSKVLVTIYDVSGRLIKTLINETKPSGSYSYYWQVTGDQNQSVADGVYFYTLQTENYKQTKKLIVTK